MDTRYVVLNPDSAWYLKKGEVARAEPDHVLLIMDDTRERVIFMWSEVEPLPMNKS